MKDILVGNGSFETLIQNNYIYVDKTKYLYELIRKNGSYYFLSRPRRFGKSLTLSTLEAIFKGRRELFKGLYIDSTDHDWKEYPVIHINFSDVQFDDANDLKSQIKNILLGTAEKYGIKIPLNFKYNEVLKALIEGLAEKEKVVVLIDEYDSTLSNNINSDNLEDIRLVLRGFYSVLKAQDKNIRMCFITGVTKFSKVSIFSAMNNLIDISLDDDNATLLGYTQEELESYFDEYIKQSLTLTGVKREEFLSNIKVWYDGYKFSPKGETVYNPVSIGSYFNSKTPEIFTPYWIDTGGMSYLLTEVAKRVEFDISAESDYEVAISSLRSVDLVQMVRTDVNMDNFLSLLFQTGYLTIKNAEIVGYSYLITLGYPNMEVKKGLTEILLPLYMGSKASSFKGEKVLRYFEKGNGDGALSALIPIYADVPYYELVFNAENACHASFVCMLNLMGADIIAEEPTKTGRIDAILKCSKYIYIIEFKFNQSADEAIRQIKTKKYWEKYKESGKTICLVGINFSTDKNNIAQWKEEILK